MDPADVPRHPQRPHLTLPVRVDRLGVTGPSPNQARGRRWRRTRPARYVPASVDASRAEQRILEAAQVLVAGGAVTGWVALRWAGAEWFDGLDTRRVPQPVPLAIGFERDQHPVRGAGISRERLAVEDVVALDGVPVTQMPRSVLYAARYAPTDREAVVVVDMAVRAGLVGLGGLADHVGRLRGWTGVERARKAIELADANSWSPWETRLRLVWVLDAGLPRLLCNVPVFDRAGRHLATPDLLDPEAGLAIEYDGSVHLDGRRRARDLAREHTLRDAGLEYAAVVGADMADRRRLAERLVAARGRAPGRRGTRGRGRSPRRGGGSTDTHPSPVPLRARTL